MFHRLALLHQFWKFQNPHSNNLSTHAAAAATLQDLAKAKLWQKQQRGSRQQDFAAPPVQLSRSLSDPHSCTLQQWAPLGGPVRPLLQVRWLLCNMLHVSVQGMDANLLAAAVFVSLVGL